MGSDVGQSIYGWAHETADDAFGVSWAGSEAGFDALALARTDLGLPLDEITLADQRKAEQVIYKLASGTKGPRATSAGHLRETAHAAVLVLSTGEKSLTQFVGKDLQEGARKRLVDVPAEIQSGSAFETIRRQDIHIVGTRLFDVMKRQHGAVGREWQRHLVELGPDTIKVDLNRYREDFLALARGPCRRCKGAPAGARGGEPLCASCCGAAYGDRRESFALDCRANQRWHRCVHGAVGSAARECRYRG